jgi:thiamine biosynthesis protein ThiS
MAAGNEMIMNIFINDKQVEIADDLLLIDLLKQFGYQKSVAIINGKHILQKDYASYILKKDDKVKLVRILGGG